MGLDQYLYKRTYLKTGEWYKPEFLDEIKLTRGGKEVNTDKIRYIVEEVAYWRKANAIHRWFVQNVQDGVDDCDEYAVSLRQLDELKSECEKVLKAFNQGDTSVAKELLPTQNGFFFGTTDYDEYYFSDLEDTVNMIERILINDDEDRYYYTSSW